MDREAMIEARNHYDTTSTAGEMDGGAWETDVDPDPMVTTSVRLPKSLLDWVREQADAGRVKPTALIRRWIEERREVDESVAARLERLEHAVFKD